VIGVEKHAILEDWKYPSYLTGDGGKKEIDFNHYVTVQYVNVDQSSEDEFGYKVTQSLFSFSKEMFYPAFIRSMIGSIGLRAYSIGSIFALTYLILN
jgi:hypothetical protein